LFTFVTKKLKTKTSDFMKGKNCYSHFSQTFPNMSNQNIFKNCVSCKKCTRHHLSNLIQNKHFIEKEDNQWERGKSTWLYNKGNRNKLSNAFRVIDESWNVSITLAHSLIGHLSIKTKQKYSSNPTTHDDLHKRKKCNSGIVKR
jgi:hypothetical protein